MNFSEFFSGKLYKKFVAASVYLSVLVAIVALFFVARLSDGQKFQQPPIKVEREFRAAWVATVANINWPSEPGLTVEIQKREAVSILDSIQSNNLNAVIFQVRPQADALYQSQLEPWSYYLTGEQGRAPDPLYDPLQFWIEESHKRGIELHAWLNPYRAHHIKGGDVSEYSVVNTRPELVVQLETGYHWLVPTKKETIEYSLNVVMDIVERYNVDGIHFDDYFYPYPSYNNGKEFPDQEDYEQYRDRGGRLSRDDWRRDAVNTFVKTVYQKIKAEKKTVKFGISPFGIWRPGYPESIAGFDQYEKLFADAKLWLNKGWLDYFVPQLYWQINRYPQSYPILLNWWESENTKNRHLWPGIHTRLAEDEKANIETINQIMISRAMLSNRPGNIFWNVSSLGSSPLFHEMLTSGPYKNQALAPASKWLDSSPPDAPDVQTDELENQLIIHWQQNTKDDIAHRVVYTKYADKWQYQILASLIDSATVDTSQAVIEKDEDGKDIEVIYPLTAVGVTAVDSAGNESSFMTWEISGNKLNP